MPAINCPACNQPVLEPSINLHLDSNCTTHIYNPSSSATSSQPDKENSGLPSAATSKHASTSFFATPIAKRQATLSARPTSTSTPTPATAEKSMSQISKGMGMSAASTTGQKRTFSDRDSPVPHVDDRDRDRDRPDRRIAPGKKAKSTKGIPLAERMRPTDLDGIFGQDLVGKGGVLRALIEVDRVPSMILWGPPGTGKTTIARCIARMTSSRFLEINATTSGVPEVKKLFDVAVNEAALTGKRTIIFCDEIHRFSRAQQEVFLKPVESGGVVLVGATTENPSFKVGGSLLSRCRVFTLGKLGTAEVKGILSRAVNECVSEMETEEKDRSDTSPETSPIPIRDKITSVLDDEMLTYLANFASGDARTALNLLDLALSLAASPSGTTKPAVKATLTRTLVYDRAGDAHYDTISAFHKSVRGNDPHATLYYLALMLESGEDPLFIARRMVVIASEDVGLADNSLLPLATAAYTATQQIGLPEARIPLAHCATALALAPKSTRAYRGLNNAMAAVKENEGAAGRTIPLHLRNAPTRLMTELGYGVEYKYPPNYRDGRVKQEYLPEGLQGRMFLEERDLGEEVDPDLEG